MEISYTTGTAWKQLLILAAPIAISRLLQSLYNITDTKIIGLFQGDVALAAVGSVSSLYHLLNGFIDGIALGCCIVLAFYSGNQNREKTKEVYSLMTMICFLTPVIMTVVLCLLLNQVLILLQVPEKEQQMAGTYLFIMLLGLTVMGINCMYTHALRTLGDPWSPLYILGISTAVNVFLDLLFIGVIKTGVGGAAWATVISQTLSCVLCYFRFRKKERWIRFSRKYIKGNAELFFRLLKDGLSMGLQSCIVNIGTVALQIAINEMGTAIIVAHTAARRIFELMYIPFASLGFAMVTYTASNRGAWKIDRVHKGYRTAFVLIALCSIITASVGEFLPGILIAFMASTENTEILLWGTRYLRIELPALFLCGIVVVSRNLLQGMERRTVPLLSSILELFIKIFCALLSLHVIYYWGIIISEPLSWAGMIIMLLYEIKRGCPKKVVSMQHSKG